MKTLLVILCALVLTCAARADTTSSLVGNLLTIDNTTNNTPAVSFGSFGYFHWASFTITNGGLTDTNALTLRGQFSLDGTNWATVITHNLTSTNATNHTWSPELAPQAGYWRLQIVTTNSVDLNVVGRY